MIVAARPFGPLSPELAEDLLQDALIRLCKDNYRSLRQLKGSSAPLVAAYVRSVAVTTTLDHFRRTTAVKRFGRLRAVPVDEVTQPTVPPSAERDALLEQVDRALTRVARQPRDRQIFWLYYRHGLTSQEIAKTLHGELTVKGVESVLHRLGAEIREMLATPEKGKSAGARPDEGGR